MRHKPLYVYISSLAVIFGCSHGHLGGIRCVNKTDSSSICLPNLFLVGFQQCGSTALFRLLLRHPDIQRIPGHPEAHWLHKFLSKLTHQGSSNAVSFAETYLGRATPHSRNSRYLLDASRGYATEPPSWMPKLVHAVAGVGVRIIVIVRDPAARLWSSMRRWCKDRGVNGTGCTHMLRSQLRKVVTALNASSACRQDWSGVSDGIGLKLRVAEEEANGERLLALWQRGMGVNFPKSTHHCALSSAPEEIEEVPVLSDRPRGPGGHYILDLRQMIMSGAYATHLLRWMAAIPPSSFAIVRSSSLQTQPKFVARCLSDFLGIDRGGFGSAPWPSGQTSGLTEEQLSASLRLALQRLYAPEMELLRKLVRRFKLCLC